MLDQVSEEQPRKRRKVRPAAIDLQPADTGVDEAAPAAEVVAITPAPASKGILHRVKLDPAHGLGLFVPGLFVMALAGAMTWHWIFVLGEGVMMLGMGHFVAAVTLTALQQRMARRALATPKERAQLVVLVDLPPAKSARAEREHAAPSASPSTAET